MNLDFARNKPDIWLKLTRGLRDIIDSIAASSYCCTMLLTIIGSHNSMAMFFKGKWSI